MASSSTSAIRDFYRGKNVFITGGTGFVGKTLLEKLIRSLGDDLGTVYLLIRSGRRGETVEQRLDKLLSRPPLFFKGGPVTVPRKGQIRAVQGDLTLPGLGLDANDRIELLGNVNVIIHCGASIKLNGLLHKAAEANLRATHKVLELASQISPPSRLVAFIHVSTSFLHPERELSEERLYPVGDPHQDPDEFLQWMDSLSQRELLELDKEAIVGNKQLTYLFTKAVPEPWVAKRAAAHRLPVAIVRPSFILATVAEPVPGWLDSLVGPAAVAVVHATGLLRTVRLNPDLVLEIIPVDWVVNCLIAVAWYTANQNYSDDLPVKSDVPIFVLNTSDTRPVKVCDMVVAGFQANAKYPSGRIFRPLSPPITKTYSELRVTLERFLYETCVAHLVDTILALLGHRRLLVKTTRRIHATAALDQKLFEASFLNRCVNTRHLLAVMSKADRRTFNFDTTQLDPESYVDNCALGYRRYVFKEPDETLPAARARYARIVLAYQLATWTFYAFISWIIFKIVF